MFIFGVLVKCLDPLAQLVRDADEAAPVFILKLAHVGMVLLDGQGYDPGESRRVPVHDEANVHSRDLGWDFLKIASNLYPGTLTIPRLDDLQKVAVDVDQHFGPVLKIFELFLVHGRERGQKFGPYASPYCLLGTGKRSAEEDHAAHLVHQRFLGRVRAVLLRNGVRADQTPHAVGDEDDGSVVLWQSSH